MSMSHLPESERTYVKPRIMFDAKDGRTKQSFGPASDINAIVSTYRKTGLMRKVEDNPGIFADVSEIDDYPGMVRKVRFAQESFEQLPANLRSRFMNDPARLIEFVSDSSNRDEAIKLGIVPKPSKKAVVVDPKVPVVAKAEEPKVPSKAKAKPKD